MILSFYYAKTIWKRSLIYYLVAFVGDVVDGKVARIYNESMNLFPLTFITNIVIMIILPYRQQIWWCS